jgi:hypothetical protein
MKLPQLTLRELFLLVALAALGCGWWVREWQSADRELRLRTELERTQIERNAFQTAWQEVKN